MQEITLEVEKFAPSASQEDVAALFNSIDTDGSGSISLDEFISHVVPKNEVKEEEFDAGENKVISVLDMDDFFREKKQMERRGTCIGWLFVLCFLLYPGVVITLPLRLRR